MNDDGGDAHPRFYKDMVEYHDKVIGRLLDYLAEQGLSEDTLVIYTGDNGSPQEVCSVTHRHNEICGGKGKTERHRDTCAVDSADAGDGAGWCGQFGLS